ncbi:hypothetical protein [Arenimonas sp.]|uniref:hypothetical protein n=1 Tax=Arenimonas sp. TaxID=1872635 RepID=UPI0039E3DDAD
MNANELIESYVADVAARLPRRQRNDVAFELRALLGEELAGKAEFTGREADAAMAMELLRGFGRPADVAARYQPTLTLIDPTDGRSFLRLAVAGVAVVVLVRTLAVLPLALSGYWLSAIGSWWASLFVPSLCWLGLLVVGFGSAAWARRRWPESAEWKPRVGDNLPVNRAGLAMGVIGILCGVYLLANPTWLLDVFLGGRAAPAAYEALAYTDSFRQKQAPWLFGLQLLFVPIFLALIVKGRWSPMLRRIFDVHGLLLYAVAAWALFGGPIFRVGVADSAMKLALLLTLVWMLIHYGMRWSRRVKPRPD